jgi:hypothetical protein
MAFIGLPCPTNKTGIRGVFSPNVINWLIVSDFMAFTAKGNINTDPRKDRRFITED